MLQPDQLEKLLEPVIKKVKSYDSKLKNKRNAALEKLISDFKELPDFHPTYKKEVELMESIRPHAIKGVFPHKMFLKNAPNQTKQEMDYVKDNFKQVTLTVFVDCFNTYSRIFHDGNWSITYADEGENVKIEDTFQHYVEKKIKEFGSLENYVKILVAKQKLIDANGVICVRPEKIPTETIEKDGEQKAVVANEFISPTPVYYSCKQKVGVSEDYFIFWLNEKSEVESAGAKEKKGHIFEIYDDTNIYRYIQVGKFEDYNFDLTVFWRHDLGFMPCAVLTGQWDITEDGHIIWQSPFSMITDLLDEALLDNSNLRIIKTKYTYPHRVSIGQPCDFEDPVTKNKCGGGGRNGMYIDESGNEVTCKKCGGIGQVSRFSILGELFINPTQNDMPLDQKDNVTAQNAMAFHAPPMEPGEFLKNEVQRNIETAKKILHINKNENKVSGTEITATEALTNLKALYAAVKPFSDQAFSLYEFILNCIGKMRYRDRFVAPELKYPVTFDFATEEDYVWQLEKTRSLGIPLLTQAILYKYLSSLYYNEKKTSDAFKLIFAADALFSMTSDDIRLDKTIEPWQVVLHRSPITLIKELERENENFFEQEPADQIKALEELAKTKVAVQPEATQEGIVNDILGERAA